MDLNYFAQATGSAPDWQQWIQLAIPVGVSLATAALGTWAFLNRYREKVDQLEKINAQQRISTLEGQLGSLQGQVTNLAQNSPNNYVQRNSPLSLNQNGKELLLDSGAQEYIDSNFDELFSEIRANVKELSDYSAYDVQESAANVVMAHSDDAAFKPLKDYAFAQGIQLPIIQQVASIYLRDLALNSLGFDLESYYKSKGDGHEHKLNSRQDGSKP